MKDYFDDIKKLLGANKAYEQLVESQGVCLICGHDNPMDLEYHHIGGKSNSPIVISLCRNCHGRLSRKQYFWPKGWSSKSKPSMKALAILLRGLSDVLRVISDYLWEMSYDK
jgi:hypothetical protein